MTAPEREKGGPFRDRPRCYVGHESALKRILSSIVFARSYWTAIAIGSWMARNSRGSGKNMVSVTVATVSTSIV